MNHSAALTDDCGWHSAHSSHSRYFNGVENRNGNNGKDHGWKKVTNLKKQRRHELKGIAGSVQQQEGEKNGAKESGAAAEFKGFQALETEAAERRNRLEARIAAALAAGESGEEEPNAEAGEHQPEEANGTVVAGEVKKSKPKKANKPKVTVADAAAAIDPSDLSTFLADITESFASVPDVQLMRCADYFAHAFASITSAQFAWNKILRESPVAKTIEVPLCYIPENVSKMMGDWLAQRPVEALSKFVLWLLKEVLEDSQSQQSGSHKGPKAVPQPSRKTKVGVLVLLAIALRRRPDLLHQQAGTVRSQFQGQDKLPTLVWMYGQVAQGDLVSGMYLWVQNLLPFAVGKFSTPFSRDIVLQFVESVLFANLKKARPVLLNGHLRKGERLVPPLSLDLVMRVSFPADSTVTKATERFQSIYPVVRELALAGKFRSKATRAVAQQLLPLSLAALSEDVETLSLEAYNNFSWCLSQNPECYKQWEKLYLENQKASSYVLSHLLNDWKDAVARLTPLSDLHRTLQAFRTKHKHLLQTAKQSPELEAQLKAADRTCKALEGKMSWVPSCAKATLTIAVGVSMAYAFYLISPDVNPWKWDGWLLLSKTHPFI
ncbi:unnamed protein product [Sphagnum jensenii]|uniref:Transmembrane protein 214-A n=1 Tax=Sphagnum jensenii TaxID=128206 RepID=A0ABP1BRV5_9BRYO